jgi:hypothetical protein
MLQQVVAYNIIESDKHAAMTDGVNAAIKDGWVPSGPLVLQGDHMMQVMIRFGS